MKEPREKETLLQEQEVKIINIGLELFAQSLKQQEARVVHLAWKPPADGDAELMDLLDQLL